MLISNENTFLHFEEDIEMIYLQPSLNHRPGVYKDSKIIFLMDASPWLTFSVTIEATIERCQVGTASFDSGAVHIGYFIGDDTSSQLLPDVLQEPACNDPIESYSYVGTSNGISPRDI